MAIDPVAPKDFALEQLEIVRSVVREPGARQNGGGGVLAAEIEAFLIDAGGLRPPVGKATSAQQTTLLPSQAGDAPVLDTGSAAIDRTLLGLQRAIAAFVVNLPQATAQRADGGPASAKAAPAATREIERRYVGAEDGSSARFEVAEGRQAEAARPVLVAPDAAASAARETAATGTAVAHTDQRPADVCVVVYWQSGAKPEIVDIRVDRDGHEQAASGEGSATPRVIRFEIDAHPRGLVSVVLSSVDARVSVSLSADHPDMAAALNAHLGDLSAGLSTAGIELAGVTVVEGVPGSSSTEPIATV